MHRYRTSASPPPPSLNEKPGFTHASNHSVSNKHGTSIIISKWSAGWSTICSMYSLYILSCALALLHFMLFRSLDGKLVSNSSASSCSGMIGCVTKNAMSQAYTSTASILISNAFSIALRMSLAIAFTQYLWKILRNTSMKVDTIELLFNIRSDFFKLFYPSIIKKAWVLILMALLLYLTPIATSFPPGALTVESEIMEYTAPGTVPTFNPSYIGNGSFAEVSRLSLSGSSISPWDGWIRAYFITPQTSLQHLAAGILLNDQMLGMSSPCGPNCSYTIDFEGPSFQCQSETKNQSHIHDMFVIEDNIPTLYAGVWKSNLPWLIDITTLHNISISPLNATEQKKYLSQNISSYFAAIFKVTSVKSMLSCTLSRSLYKVKNSYVNGEQTLGYTLHKIRQTSNQWDAVLGAGIPFSHQHRHNSALPQSFYEEHNWSGSNLTFYRDSQLAGVLGALASVLSGSCIANIYSVDGIKPSINGSSTILSEAGCVGTGLGGSIISYTSFLNGKQPNGLQTDQDIQNLSFNITEESLNKLLANFTLSIIPYLGLWNDTVNITRHISQNVYSFSQPINLLIPYSLSLVLAFPCILLGTFALVQNGIPANDGGFIQILSTTTGSPALQIAAAGNCLAGDGRPSEHLRNLKVRYGELVGLRTRVGGTVVRRAGFGTEGEVLPLKKGEKYGVVGKI